MMQPNSKALPLVLESYARVIREQDWYHVSWDDDVMELVMKAAHELGDMPENPTPEQVQEGLWRACDALYYALMAVGIAMNEIS